MVALEKQAVAPSDKTVFCPLRYEYVSLARCLECGRLVRADQADPPRYVVCDARVRAGWTGVEPAR